MNELNPIVYLIIFFGIINLIRMAMFLVGSDIYSYKQYLKSRKNFANKPLYPKFSVVIPAYNEEGTIVRAVRSILKNNYPKDRIEIIVVDDGSIDDTYKRLKNYKKKYHVQNLTIIRQPNAGKANALNNAIKNYSTGDLIMSLDADSFIDSDALFNATQYFRDRNVKAIASNVKIIPRKGILNLIQQFEYLICYQMKRAQTVFNIEYIIGGIGSVMRKSVLKNINYYDRNTVTEDIDATMKILRGGNKENRVIYASDVVAYTEAVLDIRGLIKQRYRWKWGRCQTFLKNRDMFFNNDKKFTKWLTFVYLPFAIFGDIAYFFEPIIISYILYVVFRFSDLLTVASAFAIITAYMSLNVIMEESLKFREKTFYLLIAPAMYFYFYILSFVEYLALIRAILNLPNLQKSIQDKVCSWQHVRRPNQKLSFG